ncbi:hypothetical protein [Rugosimonospora africana]|uniref:Uncharacterized protein n=1 Tax=Rugosimonospora africana TaxID=556532 RepID=A0A8J3VV02_9ACTN|nr:hypothetical protein [Rugosimonospora africana]GIH19765.1 hypothetical protein Raf01_79370 [Rugosimonospora africana]
MTDVQQAPAARLDVARTSAGVDAGDAVLSRVTGGPTDADLDAPTPLDGRTGIVTPMYADVSRRVSAAETSGPVPGVVMGMLSAAGRGRR